MPGSGKERNGKKVRSKTENGTRHAISRTQRRPQRFTYWNPNATKAQVTTTASRMFQISLQYEPGCKIKPKSMI